MIGPPSAMPRANRSMAFGSNIAGLVSGGGGATGAGGGGAGGRITAAQTRSNLSVLLLTRGRHGTPPAPHDHRPHHSVKGIPQWCTNLFRQGPQTEFSKHPEPHKCED